MKASQETFYFQDFGSFPLSPPPPPPADYAAPPAEAVAAATSVFTEYNSQISNTFQEADCLLKLK